MKKINKLTTSLTLNFFKFLKIKKSKNKFSNMKNMQIFKFLMVFFLEKNTIKNSKILFWTLLFKQNVSILHKKTTFLRNFRLLSYLNKKFFLKIKSKRFLKRLFGFWKKKFFWSKLKKISFFFLKKYALKKTILDKKKWFFLARDVYFSLVNLKGFNTYFFKKKILSILFKKNIFHQLFLIKLFKKKNVKWGRLYKMSASLSNSISKIYLNTFLVKKLQKFWKKFYSLQLKTESFFKIFSKEFQIPYQNLFFRYGVLKYDTSRYLLLPYNNFVTLDYKIIINFFKIRYENLGLRYVNFYTIKTNDKTLIKKGLNFFNTNRLEKIIFPLLGFFLQYKTSFILPITYQYTDFFFIKKKSLPIFSRWFLKFFLTQNFNTSSKTFYSSTDTKNNKLLTLLFYNVLSELFYLLFAFSPAKTIFLNSKDWKNLFFSTLSPLNLVYKNWELLIFYSNDFIFWKWKNYFQSSFLKLKNQYKPFLYDFIYFIWYKYIRHKIIDYRWHTWVQKKNIFKYFSKTYFPIDFFWTIFFWRFFYMRIFTKINWFNRKFYVGWPKILYDAYQMLQIKFWPQFNFLKTSFEWILQYGYMYRNGMVNFRLDWNFLTTYKGTLGFWMQKKFFIKINKKALNWEKITSGYFSEMRKNSLFFTFFSFLNWSYLLQYILQFGHTKANYNTSYWDYLVMIYNEWFILNILNIQLNLKRNLKIIFKMFFLGGFVCLVGAFNILLDGLVGIYGSYSNQPYTRFIWINGLFSNFDKIFKSIQTKFSDIYSGWLFLTRKIMKWLIRLWFSIWGLIQNLTIDISFFPTLFWSSWVFLESSAWFYPTITTSNTESFLPTVFLEYNMVSNDYSLLSLSFYINLLLITFKRSKIIRLAEFSIYPQKLLGQTFSYKILPYKFNIKHFWLLREIKTSLLLLKKSKFIFFEFTKKQLTTIFKYLFIFRQQALHLHWKQNFWRYFYFNNKKNYINECF